MFFGRLDDMVRQNALLQLLARLNVELFALLELLFEALNLLVLAFD